MTTLTNMDERDFEPIYADSTSVGNVDLGISPPGAISKFRAGKAVGFSDVDNPSKLVAEVFYLNRMSLRNEDLIIRVSNLSEPKVSPFDELANSYYIAARKIIDSIRNDYRISQGTAIGERLQNLIEIDEEEILFNPKSLKTFYDFLVEYKWLKSPTLSFTPSKAVYAQWRKSADRKLSMIFLPNGTLQFVLFVPNKNRPYQIFRIAGSESIKTILQDLQPYGIDKWLKDETKDP